MTVQFHIHYQTFDKEFISISYQFSENGNAQVINLHSFDRQNWTGILEVSNEKELFYNYSLITNDTVQKEWGSARNLELTAKQIFVEDYWRAKNSLNNIFLSNAFTKVIFKRGNHLEGVVKHDKLSNYLNISVLEPSIPENTKIGIVGNTSFLGNWKQPICLCDAQYPNWKLSIPVENPNIEIEFKLVLLNNKNEIIFWEIGNNRQFNFTFPTQNNNEFNLQLDGFQFGNERWKGAGVAIPVFSIRSQNGFGIGEFLDLKLVTDWASQCGLNLVQVLPVNDTIANQNWQDSYPYAAISVFALHPLYVNVEAIATLKNKKIKSQYDQDLKSLNELQSVDFELVLEKKMYYFRQLFEQEKNTFLQSENVKSFVIANEDWLKPYAVFCHLRDKYKTSNFGDWKEFAAFDLKKIEGFYNEKHKEFEAVQFYIFLQYHADLQLKFAHQYAVDKKVILKGDLPIGIYRHSCDAWVAPELYNMNEQAGAPPDDFAVLGQNWGFPTYNWEVMAKDNYGWWRKRMQKLSEYFDALRIDHILGFFRIWQIPTDQIEGTLGMFNPRLPFHIDEIKSKGKVYDLERWTKPYIRGHFLESIFRADKEWVINEFLTEIAPNIYLLKSEVSSQVAIKSYFEKHNIDDKIHIMKGLQHLVSEVLLMEEPNSNGQFFNPRITMNKTYSYSELPDYEKPIIQKLYNDYFYSRHNEFWKRQAYTKLPALLSASNMLICGEDLGMIPDSVPEVMRNLNIITLEIQRMPKGNLKFGDTSQYPYLSVCSPSCHDMSTIRGWWESDYENASNYYYDYLKWYGLAPRNCNANIVEGIVKDHLASPSMLAVFPLQDLVGIDDQLRRQVAQDEQINEPSNPKHYWRFRFHLNMEDLIKSNHFNEKLKNLVEASGR